MTKENWRGRIVLALAHLGGMIDALVYLCSFSVFSTDLRAKILFSEGLTEWVTPTPPFIEWAIFDYTGERQDYSNGYRDVKQARECAELYVNDYPSGSWAHVTVDGKVVAEITKGRCL